MRLASSACVCVFVFFLILFFCLCYYLILLCPPSLPGDDVLLCWLLVPCPFLSFCFLSLFFFSDRVLPDLVSFRSVF